jgi:preprotein translocase subunit YajC
MTRNKAVRRYFLAIPKKNSSAILITIIIIIITLIIIITMLLKPQFNKMKRAETLLISMEKLISYSFSIKMKIIINQKLHIPNSQTYQIAIPKEAIRKWKKNLSVKLINLK